MAWYLWLLVAVVIGSIGIAVVVVSLASGIYFVLCLTDLADDDTEDDKKNGE